jgi:hypothetical protein
MGIDLARSRFGRLENPRGPAILTQSRRTWAAETEARVGPGTYLPKEQREQLHKELAKIAKK